MATPEGAPNAPKPPIPNVNRDPASAWLSSQSSDEAWNRLGQPPFIPGQVPQGGQGMVKYNPAEGWLRNASADEAWMNIGKPQLPQGQLPAPAEYPDTLNPFAIVKAGDDAWSHLSDNHPWRQKEHARSEGKDKAGQESTMSAGEAAWKLIKAGILEAGLLGLPPASKVQEDLLTFGEKKIAELNKHLPNPIKIDLEIPSTEYIAREVNRIKALYTEIDPQFLSGTAHRSGDLDRRIVERAKDLVATLVKGQLDRAYPPTAEETALAARLLHLEYMGKPKQEVQRVFDNAILSAAADIAEQEQGNDLLGKFERVGSKLDALAQQTEPDKMFIVDYVTSKLVLTKEEEETHKNITWGLTPTSLVVRNVSRGIDNFPIPLSKLTSNKNASKEGILMVSSTGNAVDVLRKKGGRLLNGIGFRLGQNFGGMIKFVSLERDHEIREIVVSNPEGTIQLLADLADTIRNTQQILLDSKGRVQKQESGMRTLYIRPNVVMAEKLKMEAPTKLASAVHKKTQLLARLNTMFANAKQAGQALLQDGQPIFTNPAMRDVAIRLQQQLAHAAQDEARYLESIKNGTVAQLPAPKSLGSRD